MNFFYKFRDYDDDVKRKDERILKATLESLNIRWHILSHISVLYIRVHTSLLRLQNSAPIRYFINLRFRGEISAVNVFT